MQNLMPKPVWNGRKCLIWSCSTLLYFIKCCFLSQALRCKQPEARHSQKGTVPTPPIPDGMCELLSAGSYDTGGVEQSSMCFQITVSWLWLIKFSSNHPEKLCPGSAPAQRPSPNSLYLISCYSQELGADAVAPDQPQQELPLLPQFPERPCTQGFHITELMIKGCPFHCLAFLVWKHHFQVTALSHGPPWLLLQSSRKLSRNFYSSLVTGRETLPSLKKDIEEEIKIVGFLIKVWPSAENFSAVWVSNFCPWITSLVLLRLGKSSCWLQLVHRVGFSSIAQTVQCLNAEGTAPSAVEVWIIPICSHTSISWILGHAPVSAVQFNDNICYFLLGTLRWELTPLCFPWFTAFGTPVWWSNLLSCRAAPGTTHSCRRSNGKTSPALTFQPRVTPGVWIPAMEEHQKEGTDEQSDVGQLQM